MRNGSGTCWGKSAGSADVILFVDEMHTIVGAGAAEGAIDAANILKPALGRGELQMLGATTLEEYRKFIEKDPALERRFRPVRVEEPDKPSALAILQGLKPGLERHHRAPYYGGGPAGGGGPVRPVSAGPVLAG